MNERIEELKRQASKEVWGTNQYTGAPEFDGYELDEDKFAELIVKECIAKIEEAAEYSPELYGVALDIQEHFGVEE